MNGVTIPSNRQIFTTVMVPIKINENASIWRVPNSTELIPVTILALEVLLGLLCNLVAAWIYLGQSGLLKNAGNKFTISLIVDDLILSGIATPLVILLELVEPATSPMLVNYLCICTRCALLFSAISSASGNTLLALDRVDITLRPSRRFFRQKRPARAVAFVWLLSGLGFIFPLFSTWASNSFGEIQQHNQTIIRRNQEWLHLTSPVQTNKEVLVEANYEAYCVTTCSNDYCELTETETIIRHSFQLVVFAAAAIAIFVSYFQILKSIHQRNVRHAKKSVHSGSMSSSSAKKTQLNLQQIFCCVESHERDVLLAMNTQTHQNSRDDCENNVSKATLSRISSHSTKSPQNVHLNEKVEIKSDSCIKQDENCKEIEAETHFSKQCKNRSSGLLVVANSDNKKGTAGRTDFVSVALSVKAIMTMKKMVREKKKRKARKIRHLKLMTVLITLTFIICWTPFNVFPLVKLFSNRVPNFFSICEVQFCFNESNSPVFEVGQKLITRNRKNPLWNALFLWTLVLASASSVVNPFLYSFSREKIRQDFKKIFCACRQTRNKIKRDCKKKDLTNLKPKPTIQTTVWSFECEKNNRRNLENLDIMKPLINKKLQNKHTSVVKLNNNGVSSASSTDAKHKLLPDTTSQRAIRAIEESTIETSCTSAATNRGSDVE